MGIDMKAVNALPEGYEEFYSVDLQKNKILMILINAISAFICAAMIIVGIFIVPFAESFDTDTDIGGMLIRLGTLFLSIIVYMILHELVHGAAMKICGTKKVKYGFTVMYAFAGSEDYYGKWAYIFIALAPVVLWGIVLAALCAIVPASWFWIVYFVEIMNISGAAGDLFVTFRFIPFPSDILVKDAGVSMTVYSTVTKSI